MNGFGVDVDFTVKPGGSTEGDCNLFEDRLILQWLEDGEMQKGLDIVGTDLAVVELNEKDMIRLGLDPDDCEDRSNGTGIHVAVEFIHVYYTSLNRRNFADRLTGNGFIPHCIEFFFMQSKPTVEDAPLLLRQ